MTFDYEKLADKYKKSPAEIKAKVEGYAKQVKDQLKDVYPADKIDTEVEKIVAGNMSNLFQLKGLDYAKEQAEKGALKTANVIVLGVSPSEDRNSYEKWQAREAYKMDPNAAIAAKKVRVQKREDGSSYPVALDSKPTIQKKAADGSVTEEPNPNYGKDIPTVLKVQVPMIIASIDKEAKEEFMMGTMTWDKDIENAPDIGKQSTVYGRINNKYFTISKDAYEGDKIYQKSFDVAMRVLPETEFWMDLTEVDSTPVIADGKNVYTKFVTKGTVQKIDIQDLKNYAGKSYQKAKVRVGSVDVVNGINLGSSYEPTVAYVHEHLQEQDEVIVFGCKKSFAKKDDSGKFVTDETGARVMVPYYELWGLVKAFDNEHDKAMERLRAAGLI